MVKTKVIHNKEQIEKSLKRIAHEILEKNTEGNDLVLIGIKKRGVTLARRLSVCLKEVGGLEVPIGELDINLYRDDLSEISSQPILRKTEVPFAVKEKVSSGESGSVARRVSVSVTPMPVRKVSG